MQRYDILKETWIYADIKHLVQEEEYSVHMQNYRQMLQTIVQARFPRLEPLTQAVIGQVTEQVILRDLIVKVSTARVEKEARQCLNELKRSGQEEATA